MITNPNPSYAKQWAKIYPHPPGDFPFSDLLLTLFGGRPEPRSHEEVNKLRWAVRELYHRRIERVGPISFREWWEKDMRSYGSYSYGRRLYNQATRQCSREVIETCVHRVAHEMMRKPRREGR